ncbi:MAG: hypothetical protein P8I83_11310 [Paracoccaceae bacterium]|nr:hypothetical protein [Paracoccaceae bacterium]
MIQSNFMIQTHGLGLDDFTSEVAEFCARNPEHRPWDANVIYTAHDCQI